ncbi:hypothetical protein HW450_10345 [Corynebacterium hindlerae]|uniref:Phage gp6-like head-tail connector protein n=1 Tax=Corynebacterium hindlerae TaxID=699041 RepID=A0A7G5FDP2_9CORY|nr:hypothetical protein [Corynebacterium hindlerae]QMV84733.1 hypothetical protein HW450_10345 [Corynebacterium hindlerae]
MITRDDVQAWLKIQVGEPDLSALDAVVAAVVSTVEGWHGTAEEWTPRIKQGAVMLAAHLWRRRGTPGGMQAFSEEGASWVQRHDPQASMLLGLGGWSRPQVG